MLMLQFSEREKLEQRKYPEQRKYRLWVLAAVMLLLAADCKPLLAQSYRLERFQDGRPLQQGKFLISAGWSFLGLGYTVDPLGVAQNPSVPPRVEDPSNGTAAISGSFGIAPFLDAGLELGGGFGGPMFAFWLKSSFLPYSSPYQLALQTTVSPSWAELRYPVNDVQRPSRLVRSSLLTVDVSMPFSYDIDKEWSILITPRLAHSGYRAGVGWDSTAPNGLNVVALSETEVQGWFYGVSIGAKVVRPEPQWWQYLLPVPFWASGSLMVSALWNADGFAAFSFGYQHLFPSFGTLLTTVTQEEYNTIESDRRQKDSIVALQKQQIEFERSRMGRALSAEIVKISGIKENGEEVPSPTLSIEEFAASERKPLLNSVFFESGSFVLPTRYKRLRSADRMSFRTEDVAHLRVVEVYRNILNIIGKRMTDKPDAKLTLTGFSLNTPEETIMPQLAERRAIAVANYLSDVWKISQNRITVTTSVTPVIGTKTDTASIRKVEISSTDADILREVETQNVQRVVSPPTINFGLDIAAGAGVKQWAIELTQVEGTEIRTLKLDNGTRSNLTQYPWNIADNPSSMPSSEENVVARVEVTDITNRVAESSLALIPVQYRTLEKKRKAAQTDVVADIHYRWLFGEDGLSGLQAASVAALEPLRDAGATLVISSQDSLNTAKNNALREALQQKGLGAAVVRTLAPSRQPLLSPEDRIYAHLYKIEYRTPQAVKQ